MNYYYYIITIIIGSLSQPTHLSTGRVEILK